MAPNSSPALETKKADKLLDIEFVTEQANNREPLQFDQDLRKATEEAKKIIESEQDAGSNQE